MLKRVLEVLAGVGLGALLVLGGLALFRSGDSTDDAASGETTPSVATTEATTPTTDSLDPEVFLAAYLQALQSDYVATVEVTRSVEGEDGASESFTEARLGTRYAKVSGGQATVDDASGTRQCHFDTAGGQWLCSNAVETPSPESLTAELREELTTPDAETSDYRVYESDLEAPEIDALGDAVSPKCFEMLAVGAQTTSPWGQSTDFCFDQRTGALIYRVVHSETRTDRRWMTELRAEVTAEDVTLSVPG